MKTFSTAYELLDYASRLHDFEITAPIDVEYLANILEITINDDRTLEGEDLICRTRIHPGCSAILLNPALNTYSARRRFTIAHALGHHCLNTNSDDEVFSDSWNDMDKLKAYWNPVESAANNFAFHLIMPVGLANREAQQVAGTLLGEDFVHHLATIFEVPYRIMERHLTELRLLA